MSHRTVAHFATALITALVTASSAAAATVIYPADGATVGSQPTFAFDFVNGKAEVELSRTADVKTSGDAAGAFVSPDGSLFSLLYTREPRDGLAPWATDGSPRRILAGRYFWHVKVRDDGPEDFGGTETPWQRTMTLTVRDEPVIFEGWTFRARKLRATTSCRNRVRVSGTIAWSDNAQKPTARFVVRVLGTGPSAKITGRFSDEFERTYARTVCVRGSTLRARAALTDTAGHTSPGESKQRSVS